MSPDEVLEKMKEVGITLSRPSLSRYEANKLIPQATRGGGGRGIGLFSNYPTETVFEAVAAWRLLNGDWGDLDTKKLFGNKSPRIPFEAVAVARMVAKAYKVDEIFPGSAVWGNGDEFEPLLKAEKALRNLNLTSMTAKKLIVMLASAWQDEFDRAKDVLK